MTIKYKRYTTGIFLVIAAFFAVVQFNSCSSDTITQIFINEVAAKDRLDAAYSQAQSTYGAETRLVMIYGKNVKLNGKTDLSAFSAFTNPDSLGAWLYIFRTPSDTSLRVYSPNPVPGSNDCIELTAFFDTQTVLSLIADTSARNIVSGALALLTSTNIKIETSISTLLNSDASLNLANTTNPIIRFNENFEPSSSSLNGNTFFSTGSGKTINMFLLPAGGTLHLPDFIQNLTGFPPDVWVVNYKKINSNNQQENLILATVVEANQTMTIPFIISSKVINLSKYFN
jgi:hypothetical protein